MYYYKINICKQVLLINPSYLVLDMIPENTKILFNIRQMKFKLIITQINNL